MGHRCCSKQKVKRGLWSPEEDEKLVQYITNHGHGSWSSVPKLSGLQRCGKSCRLRWINYLRPDLRRGSFSAQEEQIIIDVHRILGNRWAQIAKHLPGRTDNEVKNFWNSCIKKKLISQGLDPKTHNLIPSHQRQASNNNNKLNNNNNTSAPNHQQPFSIITVNPKMKDTSTSMYTVNPPLLTQPAAIITTSAPTTTIHQPPPLQTASAPIRTSTAYQNPNSPWGVNVQISSLEANIFSCVSSIETMPISSASSSSMNISGLLEDICYGSGNIAGVVEASKSVKEQDTNLPKDGNVVVEEAKGSVDDHQENMDVSFDSFSFNIGFMDSTLLSDSLCRDLSSIDDLELNF